MGVRCIDRWSTEGVIRGLQPCQHWSLSRMTTKANEPSKIVASTLGSRRRRSRTLRPSGKPIPGSITAKIAVASTGKSRDGFLLSSTPSEKVESGLFRLEEPTLGRYRRTSNGALELRMADGVWKSVTPQVDWERIERTTDAEIERQEIADLVEAALQLVPGGIAALAARLEVSPSSIRRWRRGRVMPSVAHQQRLQRVFPRP